MNPLRPGPWRLVLRRAGHDGLVVAAALATVALATTLLASGPIYAGAVAQAGLLRTLEVAPVREATLAVSARLDAHDATAADARVTWALAGVFGADGVEVHRSGLSDSYVLPARAGVPEGALAVFGHYEGLEAHAELVAGAWPAGGGGAAVDVAVPEPAAEALDLRPGATLELASARDPEATVTARVSGLYRIDDRRDAFWWDSPLEIEGREQVSFTTFGPLVVSRAAFSALGERGADRRWRAVPRADRLDVDGLAGLRRRLAALEDGLAGAGGPPLVVRGALGDTLARADRSLVAARSGVLVASVQLGVLAGAALLFLAGLLAERRSVEAALLRARGASQGEIGLLALRESALLALPAALAAPWLAALSLRALNHVGPLAGIGLELEPRVGPLSYALAAAAAALCAAGLAAPSLRRSAVTAAVQEHGRPRPAGIVRRSGLDLLLVAVAALAYWQLRRYEGPVVESLRGSLGIDPLLVAAPALGLLAGAILALRVVPLVGRLGERLAMRNRGLVAPLGAWQLARRPGRSARAVVLLTLALSIGLFASAYAGTWLRSQEDRATFEAGADVRVLPDERAGAIAARHLAGAYGRVDGVDASVPVVRRPLGVSGSPATLLAVDASRVAQLVELRPDLGRGRTLDELTAPLAAGRPRLASLPVPERAGSIAVSARISVEPLEDGRSRFGLPTRAAPPTISLVLEDRDGLLHRVVAGVLPDDERSHELVVALGDGAEAALARPVALVALELGIAAELADSRRGTLTVETLTAGSAPLAPADGVPWQVGTTELRDAYAPPSVLDVRTAGAALFELDFATGAGSSGSDAVAFSATPGRNDAAGPIPALVTDRFLERTGTDVGSLVELGPDDPSLALTGSVRGFPTLEPGAGGVVVDLRTYLAVLYATTGRLSAPREWLLDAAPGRETDVAAALRAPPFSSAAVLDRAGLEARLTGDPVALGISGALSLGFVAAAALAVMGFAVSAAVSAAERTTEFAVLRSLGLSERQLTGWLALEGGLAALLALAGGLALGTVVSVLVLPHVSLTGEGGRPFPAVVVELPWPAVAVLAGGLLAALVAILVVQLLLLRHRPLGPALRAGETR